MGQRLGKKGMQKICQRSMSIGAVHLLTSAAQTKKSPKGRQWVARAKKRWGHSHLRPKKPVGRFQKSGHKKRKNIRKKPPRNWAHVVAKPSSPFKSFQRTPEGKPGDWVKGKNDQSSSRGREALVKESARQKKTAENHHVVVDRETWVLCQPVPDEKSERGGFQKEVLTSIGRIFEKALEGASVRRRIYAGRAGQYQGHQTKTS